MTVPARDGPKVRFRFDGRQMSGVAGDTLASALLANDVHLVGRSFKYHRPRGILAAGAEEPNALVTVDRGGGRRTPNLRATQVELHEGLVAHSQNRWPSLGLDLGVVSDLVPGSILSAGFYYKTFMGPGAAWAKVWEPLIRRAAGLGRAPDAPDPDHYAHRHAFCDVLVVGAGAAGLSAALAAAEAGGRVILCDEQPVMGGGLLCERRATVDGRSAPDWAAAAVERLTARGVTLLTRTQAFGVYAQNFVALVERVTDHLAAPDPHLPRERLWKVRAGRVVLATGAIERPMVFAGNDRPGIMLAGAARTYLNRHGVAPGRRAVVFAADDSGHGAALDLAAAGVAVAALVDMRPTIADDLRAAAHAAGIEVIAGAVVTGTTGRARVSGADIARVAPDGSVVPLRREACDLVLMAGGWTPSVHLFSQARGTLRFDDALQAFVPGAPVADLASAGACAGASGLAAAFAQGTAAGGGGPVPVVAGEIVPRGGHLGRVPTGGDPRRGKAFVDFQNDVTVKDIRLAVQEGFHSIEHVKRYTTNGMATDQGKTSNMNGLAVAAEALGRLVPAVGLTTFRAPYTPVTFGAFAGSSRGDLFDPVRRTPIHGWAAARGAVFEDVGQWKRARWFPRDGEDMHAAVARECRATRAAAGIFDASTLGKIAVTGPDAAVFLDRLYTNPLTKLEPGRCRYGLMLSEAGFVIDDGIVARLAPDRFHVTTTTGGAARVLAHMEDYRQTEFPDLRVWLTSTTEQWAVIALQGPKARAILAPLVEGVDLAPDAMAHMSVRTGRILGVPMRLFRVSFTGEPGFEINVPADHGRAVWEAIWTMGEPHGLVPYGTETMHVLRAEKGYIIVGQETDGTVTPDDLGLGWAVGRSKPDFVGRRSLTRPDMLVPDRRQLVGLLTRDPDTVLEEGAQITLDPTPAPGTPALGHVTSAYRSATLGRSIALALVAAGRSRLGATLHVPMPSGSVPVTVVAPVFHDAEGRSLDG
jgi:sarcosine oxidase, subunit alpha